MKTADFRSIAKVTPTRYADAETGCNLYIGHIGHGHWQVVAEQDGQMNQTGPIAKTKMEAFSILPSVAKVWGFDA